MWKLSISKNYKEIANDVGVSLTTVYNNTGKRYKERDEKIKKYAPLVYAIVGRFMHRLPPGMAAERDDLINVGIIGLAI